MNRTFFKAAALSLVLFSAVAEAQAVDPLMQARRAYNDKQFDAAIASAEQARKLPAQANPAAVVLGRAYLERFQSNRNPADLAAARTAFSGVKSEELTPSDRTDFLVGLGVSLYVDDCTGVCLSAAAEFFDLALIAGGSPDAAARETVFEWWATSLDHQAQFEPDDGRVQIYRRILDRAEAERMRDINSASATYWIAAASRGVGDFSRAWGAAVAGWVRARYFGPRGEALRNDLHQFVYDVLLPERAKQLAPDTDPRPQLELLRKQWTDLTEKYR
ncbi:MAG TPA: hypothetical protein VN700_14310 [Vicinamibacterales bacterium]|nr:hypothetical protein [Vicinamibacterales bacterium]